MAFDSNGKGFSFFGLRGWLSDARLDGEDGVADADRVACGIPYNAVEGVGYDEEGIFRVSGSSGGDKVERFLYLFACRSANVDAEDHVGGELAEIPAFESRCLRFVVKSSRIFPPFSSRRDATAERSLSAWADGSWLGDMMPTT